MDNKKVKVRPVRRQPPSSEDVEAFVNAYVSMIGKGDLDKYLDVLWKSTDDRLREYFEEQDKEPDYDQEFRANKIRRMRSAPENIVPGYHYAVFGEKYDGVRVRYLGPVEESEDSGVPKVRVLVVVGNDKLKPGTYKIPAGALAIVEGVSQQLMAQTYKEYK